MEPPVPVTALGLGHEGRIPLPEGAELGRVENVLGPGRYQVTVDGSTLEVQGVEGLGKGDKVRVTWERASGSREDPLEPLSAFPGDGGYLSVLAPLAFGGEGGLLKVEAFWGKKDRLPGVSRPVYFLVETVTEQLGRFQWGIHLQGKRLAMQVFVEGGGGAAQKELVAQVVGRLGAGGYEWVHPVQWMAKPLRPPAGYSMSVRG